MVDVVDAVQQANEIFPFVIVQELLAFVIQVIHDNVRGFVKVHDEAQLFSNVSDENVVNDFRQQALHLFVIAVGRRGVHVVNVLIKNPQLPVDHGQIVLNGVHNVPEKFFREHVVVVLVQDLVVDFAPEDIDQGLDLQFEINVFVAVFNNAVDFINAESVFLYHGLGRFHVEENALVSRRAIVAVFHGNVKQILNGAVDSRLVVGKATFDSKTDNVLHIPKHFRRIVVTHVKAVANNFFPQRVWRFNSGIDREKTVVFHKFHFEKVFELVLKLRYMIVFIVQQLDGAVDKIK